MFNIFSFLLYFTNKNCSDIIAKSSKKHFLRYSMKVLSDKNLICKAERTFPDFIVEYQLFESEKVFDIKALKFPNKESSHVFEESTVLNFEWRKKEAILIFEKIVRCSVTPMCLEDAILELI